MKEVLYNLTVIEKPRAFDYAFNNFLIKALELFNYDTVGSKLVTFLQESVDRITNKDQTAFYVLFNSNGDLKEQIEKFSNF